MRGNCKDEGPVVVILYLASFNLLGLPGIVSFPELFVKFNCGHIMRQTVPLQHHPRVDKLEPQLIGTVMPTHHIRVKGKDVLLRSFPSPAGDSLSNGMSLQLLPVDSLKFHLNTKKSIRCMQQSQRHLLCKRSFLQNSQVLQAQDCCSRVKVV